MMAVISLSLPILICLGVFFVMTIGLLSYFKIGLCNKACYTLLQTVVTFTVLGFYLFFQFERNDIISHLLGMILIVLIFSVAASISYHKHLNPLLSVSTFFISMLIPTSIMGIMTSYEMAGQWALAQTPYFIIIILLLSGYLYRYLTQAFKTFYNEICSQSNYYYYLLGNGASPYERIIPFVRKSINDTLLLYISDLRLSHWFIVASLMFGMIISGMSPLKAMTYQLFFVVMFFCMTIIALCMMFFACRWIFFDKNGKINIRDFKSR